MSKQDEKRLQRRELLRGIARNVLLVLLIAGASFGVDYIFLRSETEVQRVKTRPDSPHYLIVENQMGMKEVNDDGELAMEITGESVTLSQDQRTAVFKGAKATYYEGGRVSLTMKAGEITYDTQTEDFVLKDGLDILTSDGMSVQADEVIWRRAKSPAAQRVAANITQVPAFAFPKGVNVRSRDGNTLQSSYMQADRELQYMEFVGNVRGDVASLQDTTFIEERGLTDLDEIKLEDVEKLSFEAEQVIYDKRKQVMLATSRFYDRSFQVMDPDGRSVKVEDYQPLQRQVTFSKEDITIRCNHIEAHIGRKWASAVGNIEMQMRPSQPKQFGEDRALQVLRRFTTSIRTDELEYFWGRDYVAVHSRARVEQDDRLAVADRLTYWGEPDKKMVLLDGNIAIVSGSGSWMFEEDLIEVDNHDMRRAVESYSELMGDRAVIYLANNDFIASGNVQIRQDERDVVADTIVYEDEIKRITAQGNVKFRDKDGQTFLCGGLVFHKQTEFLEVKGGAMADILLPAKFANDINRAIAEARELPIPPEIEDPPISPEPPRRNPNAGRSQSQFVNLQQGSGLSLPMPDLNSSSQLNGFVPDAAELRSPSDSGSNTAPIIGPLLPRPSGDSGSNLPAREPRDVLPRESGPEPAPAKGPNVADSDPRPRPVDGGKN
jgi:lipopolysaccharide export system protein LptA